MGKCKSNEAVLKQWRIAKETRPSLTRMSNKNMVRKQQAVSTAVAHQRPNGKLWPFDLYKNDAIKHSCIYIRLLEQKYRIIDTITLDDEPEYTRQQISDTVILLKGMIIDNLVWDTP